MSALAEHVQNYLQVRRALGFKLVGEEQLLREFVTFADAAGQHSITIGLAVKWAQAAVQRQPQLSLAAAARGPGLRALPAGAGSRLRGPTARAAARQQVPPDPVPLWRSGDPGVDGRRAPVAPAFARGDV